METPEGLQRAAQRLCEAVSDYLLALQNDDFANQCGGAPALLSIVRDREKEWAAAHPEPDCRDLI